MSDSAVKLRLAIYTLVIPQLITLMKTKALTEGPGRTWEVTTQDLLREACSSRYSVWPRCAEGPCQSIGNEVIRIGSSLPKAILDAIAQVRRHSELLSFYESLTVPTWQVELEL